MRWSRRAVWSLVALATTSTVARAGERVDLSGRWPADWRRVGVGETIAVGSLATLSAVLRVVWKAPDQARWDSTILFDEDARNALRASSESGRSRAAAFSNAAYALGAVPLVVDAGLVTWLGHGKADAAGQLALIDLEAIAVTTLLTTGLQRSVGRARPFLRECASNPAQSNCPGSANSRNTSFISGHASLAFAGATTLCVQHSRLSLYGSADAVVCPAALGIAAGSSMLRVVADRHWVTDVIAGAIVGSAVGAVVSAVHLRKDGSPPAGVTLGEEGRSMVYWRQF